MGDYHQNKRLKADRDAAAALHEQQYQEMWQFVLWCAEGEQPRDVVEQADRLIRKIKAKTNESAK